MFKAPLIKNHEMKLGLQAYAVILPIKTSYIKFNNNGINILQRHDIIQNCNILENVL
jgi:hypothetical protein